MKKLLSILVLGFSVTVTQLVFMREFLSIFSGNELVLGITLGMWFLLIGAGAYIGRFIQHPRFLIAGPVAVGILPLLLLCCARLMKALLVQQGELIGLYYMLLIIVLVLLPMCPLFGILLTIIAGMFKTVGEAYTRDTIGSIIGGFVFSFILVYFLNSFQVLTIVFLVNMLVAMYNARSRVALIAVGIMGIALILFLNPHMLTTQLLYKGQDIVYEKSSLYGNIVVTKTGAQLNFFENGVPLFTTENTLMNEEAIHYALLQHDNPKHVLLVGGAASGTPREVQKYGALVDYLEIDNQITRIARLFTSNLDNVTIINQDARFYLKNTNKRYDAIVMDIPKPTTSLLNRLYTTEFFGEAKTALNPGGVFSFSLGSSENYYSDEIKELFASEFQSLKPHFKNIIVVPGSTVHFIASDNGLSYNYTQLLSEKNIATSFVNPDYIKGFLTADRLKDIDSALYLLAPVNTDFHPISYYYWFLNWVKQFNYVYLILVLLGIVVLWAHTIKPIPFAVFSTGFAGSGWLIILLIGFQIVSGYVYQMLGILVTCFMIGIATGSFLMNRRLEKVGERLLIMLQVMIAVFSFALLLLNRLPSGFSMIVFPSAAVISGFLVGMVFPLASKLYGTSSQETAGVLFPMDYLGSFFGALLLSAFLIPLLGLSAVVVIIGFFSLMSTAGLLWKDGFFKTILLGMPIIVVAYFVIRNNQYLFGFTFSTIYLIPFFALLFFGFMVILFFRSAFAQPLKQKVLNKLSFFVFLPAVFYPMFRCFFRIPYLFCHVCPKQCIFGYVRPTLVPAALLQNIDGRFWCYNLCPIGTVQDAQCKKSLRLPRWIRHITRIFILLFDIGSYLVFKYRLSTPFTSFIFKNVYTVSVSVLGIAALIFIVSFFVRRFWCDYFCPVGGLSEYILRIRK